MNGDELFELVDAQLRGVEGGPPPTSAKGRVQRPGVLPTQPGKFPMLKLRMIGEAKQSQGRGTPGWLTVVTIRVVGEVSAPANLTDPLTSDIEVRLWALKREIETAIINSYPLFAHVQQLVSVQTQLAYALEGTHLAGIQSDYAFEIFESGEAFAPLPSEPLTEIRVSDPLHPGLGFVAGLTA